MENGLPALVIASILMLCTVLMARGGFMGADAIGQTLRQSETRYGQQNRTGLEVTGTSIDASGANVTITVKNDGQTPLANFADMDVVLQYFGETGTRFDKWVPYTSGALAADTWKTGTFTNDVFEPGILNAGESMELLIRVNPVVGPATTNLAVIGSDKGVTVQTYFAGPP
jgi:archaellum component FlaF (FlaF/FlaG flagellin family)